MGVLFFQKQKDIKLYTRKYQETYGNIPYVVSAPYIKDSRIRRVYSGIKQKAADFAYLQFSPYCDADGSSHLRSCLRDAVMNTTPRIGQIIEKLEWYIQYPPRRAKDTKTKDLEKCDCLSSVMTIEPLLNIDREKMGAMRIIQVINDGVYVCIYRVYLDVFK